MSPYSPFVAALLCLSVLVSVLAGAATYRASRQLKPSKGVAVAGLTLGAIIIGLPALSSCLSEVKRCPQTELEPTVLAGVWTTTYQNVGPFRVSGVETVTFKTDGTYQQTYENGSYRYQSLWNPWWIENGCTVHLVGGRFYLHGISLAEKLEESDAWMRFTDEIVLDGTDIVLFARSDPDTPGQLVLEHLPVGDPDDPKIVQFRRVSTWIPDSGDNP